MAAQKCLPSSARWPDDETYVESLLSFAANTNLFRNLCGGIHILDFLTRTPDLYATILPLEWREWFETATETDVLDLLLHEDLTVFSTSPSLWHGLERPPQTLLDYVKTVRGYSLLRKPSNDVNGLPLEPMPRRIAVGMKPKKIHEVEKFARYVNRLTEVISEEFDDFIGDIVDFGSGQNYLGRTLASPPYNKHVIAIERRHHVLEGGRKMDVHAKLAKKEKILRNKKEWKRLQKECESTPQIPPSGGDSVTDRLSEMILDDGSGGIVSETENEGLSGRGRMTYIEHDIQNGYLDDILDPGYSCPEPVNTTATNEPEQDSHEESTISSAENRRAGRMVISLHSCGNLVHHGLRSLVLNSSVSAVAMIGCCYNLMTERLGPASYKLPSLRPFHPRLESTSNAFDPHGFPMSHRLETFSHDFGTGLRLNITARMMAVQAPYNWGPDDSEAFFRRHFYRALLQRILLDVGVVDKPVDADGVVGGDLTGITASGSPLIVGSLRKAAFESFHSYASAALSKLSLDPQYGNLVKTKTSSLTSADFSFYETKYAEHKKRLAVIWSLMAFSAGVVESIIAVDRWLFLKEQDCVEKCWVEPVFEYGWSPRNLVVVGVKKSAKKW